MEDPGETNRSTDGEAPDEIDAAALVSTSTYKVLGELAAPDGSGVVGRNTATTGQPIGVAGTVTAPRGYGLYTPDNLGLEGRIETRGNEFRVRTNLLGGAVGNVVLGAFSNSPRSGVKGAAIFGGGFNQGNDVYDDFGVVGGGDSNSAGTRQTSDTIDARWATVSGGVSNVAAGEVATVGGGGSNTAEARGVTVGGGASNKGRGEFSTVGGGLSNTTEAAYATVAGGGPSDPTDQTTREATKNVVYDEYGTIVGGGNNQAGSDDASVTSATYATVAGGFNNTASAPYSIVAGGQLNEASNREAFVGGGDENIASGDSAGIVAGFGNTASADVAAVLGGNRNTASGRASVAMGEFADTNGKAGAVVIGDSSTTAIQAQNTNELRSQIPMYAPAFNQTSARAAKTNVEAVDPEAMLAGVESLDVSTWELAEGSDDRQHVGPMADDFAEAFELDGADEASIASVDADGVLFAAVQALSANHDAKDERIDDLEVENERLRESVADLRAENERLHDRLADLEDRVDAVESAGPREAPADD